MLDKKIYDCAKIYIILAAMIVISVFIGAPKNVINTIYFIFTMLYFYIVYLGLKELWYLRKIMYSP
jgi:hypothetical protein